MQMFIWATAEMLSWDENLMDVIMNGEWNRLFHLTKFTGGKIDGEDEEIHMSFEANVFDVTIDNDDERMNERSKDAEKCETEKLNKYCSCGEMKRRKRVSSDAIKKSVDAKE